MKYRHWMNVHEGEFVRRRRHRNKVADIMFHPSDRLRQLNANPRQRFFLPVEPIADYRAPRPIVHVSWTNLAGRERRASQR